ncbi:MAG: DUF4349 domain-containing protein [Thermoanaerobaculia bacterium]
MKRLRLAHLLVAAAIVTAAIAALLAVKPSSRETGMASAAAQSMRLASSTLTRTGSVGNAPEETAERAVLAERRLIRTGTLSVEVRRYAEAAEKAVAIAEAHGGYLSGAKAAREAGDRQRGMLTLSVEARSFDAVFRKLKELGHVESAAVETRDATRDYADLETRLSVKRDAQARLLEILRTRTGKLSDLVEAESELSRLVEEAERLEGERRYLAKQVELATITIEIFEPAAFLRDGAAAPLFQAVRDALPLLSRSLAMMLYASAAALPWVIVAILAWKLRKRSRVRRLIRIAGEG